MDVGRNERGLGDWIRRLLTVPVARYPLATEPAPLRALPEPEALTFFLGRSNPHGPLLAPTVHAGDAVEAGQRLGRRGDALVLPSPVSGTVARVRQAPDVRGGKPGLAVTVTPSSNGARDASATRPLDPRKAPVEELRQRVEETGLALGVPEGADGLVVLGADAEPGLSAVLRLLLDDPVAAVRATALAARLVGADRAVLAVLEPHAGTARAAADGAEVEILPLPPEYPATLPAVVSRRATRGRALVVSLADALAVLTAVETGLPPADRVITVLDADGAPVANFRVPIGTSLGHVLEAAGLQARPGDKVVTGGALRGLAQYSLDAAVDGSVDGLFVVRAGTTPSWSEEPCVNCGSCLDVCPERLPAHLLARFAEFGLFDRAAEGGLDDCIECGLCATVCPARRPMLQRIRLAKREVAAQAVAEAEALAAAAAGQSPRREPDPIPVPVAGGRKG